MKKYSLYNIILIIFLIASIVFSFTVYWFVNERKKGLLETSVQEKTQLASIINETVFNPNWRYLETSFPMLVRLETVFVQEMANFKDVVYIRTVKPNGEIYQSNIEEEIGKSMDPNYIVDINEVTSTKKTKIRDDFYKDEKIKLIIYPGYENYTILLGFSLKSIEQATKEMTIRDVAMGVGNLLFVLLVLLGILRSVINPLKKMTESCEEIRKGNLDIKIETKSKTEIGELVETFNETIKDLKQSQAAIEETKTVLEIKVAARTRELKELTERQEKMIEEKTKELQVKIEELERFNKLVVGRELKMIELKEEIKKMRDVIERKKRK